jgi:hypothetical protein
MYSVHVITAIVCRRRLAGVAAIARLPQAVAQIAVGTDRLQEARSLLVLLAPLLDPMLVAVVWQRKSSRVGISAFPP